MTWRAFGLRLLSAEALHCFLETTNKRSCCEAVRAGVICISRRGLAKEYMRGFATSALAQGDEDGKGGRVRSFILISFLSET